MRTRWALVALLAPLAMAALPSHADAQSRGNVGGYSSGAAVGGGVYGGGPASRPAITRTAPLTRVAPTVPNAPAVRSSPAVPPNNPVTNPRSDIGGSYPKNSAIVLPGTRATTVRPGYTGR